MDVDEENKLINIKNDHFIGIDELNELIGSKSDFYNTCVQLGNYLPELERKCITNEYLRNVFEKNVFTIELDSLKFGFLFRYYSKVELLSILRNLTKDKPIGMNENQLPNKDWLINCIKTLDANNEIFKREPKTEIKRKFDKL